MAILKPPLPCTHSKRSGLVAEDRSLVEVWTYPSCDPESNVLVQVRGHRCADSPGFACWFTPVSSGPMNSFLACARLPEREAPYRAASIVHHRKDHSCTIRYTQRRDQEMLQALEKRLRAGHGRFCSSDPRVGVGTHTGLGPNKPEQPGTKTSTHPPARC